MLKINLKKALTVGILSLLFSFMQTAGWRISMDYGSSFFQDTFLQNINPQTPWQYTLCGVLHFIISFGLFYFFFSMLENLESKQTHHSNNNISFKRFGFISFIVLITLWMFFLWGCYPGYYIYDVGNQLPQFLYPEVPYNAHHPLLHTLILGSLISLGYQLYTVDISFGIFIYIVFQMTVCAACLSYSLYYIFKRTHSRILASVSFCFYALCPPIVMFAMCTTKDILCFSILLVAIIRFMEITQKLEDNHSVRLLDWILLGGLLSLSCLLRNNIIYAVIIFPALSLLLIKKGRLKQLLLYIGVILIYLTVNKSLLIILDAVPSSINEALCVPYQQIARLYNLKGADAFTSEEYALLSKAIPPEALCTYDPVMADYTKSQFSAGLETIMKNKWDYLNLWVQKGLEYPDIYIDSFLFNTYQAWYPFTILTDMNGPRYFDTSAYSAPHWQGLYDFYEDIRYCGYVKYPIIRLFFSIGTMFWVTLIALFYAIWKKDRICSSALLLVLLVCTTAFFGPVSDVRYYLILFYMFPVSLGIMLPNKINKQ